MSLTAQGWCCWLLTPLSDPPGHFQTAPTEEAVPAAAPDASATLQWKAQTLEEMMQSVTAAEQRMLDISSMRVA